MKTEARRDATLGTRRIGALAAAILLAAGCTTTRRIEVSSLPPGARILIDGEDSGLRTPSDLQLPTKDSSYTVSLEKPGYNPASRVVRLQKDVDVIEPSTAAGAILCAPCCLGLPLLAFLRPVEVDTHFVPRSIHAVLDLAGQGIKLRVTPETFEAYVDGSLQSPIDGTILTTTPGDHELELLAGGYRPYRRTIHVDERVYVELRVEMDREGQGLRARSREDGARIYIDGQFEGSLGHAERAIPLPPGPHEVRVELEGYRTWTNVFQIAADHYVSLELELQRAGQGVIVHKPEGYPRRSPPVQILLDGALHESAFDRPIRLDPGTYELEVRVKGYRPWTQTVRVAPDTYLDVQPSLRRGK